MALSLEGIRSRLAQQGLIQEQPERSFYTYGAVPTASVSDNAQAEQARKAALAEQTRLAEQQRVEDLRRQQETERLRQTQLDNERKAAEAQQRAAVERQRQQAEAARVAQEQAAAREKAEAQRRAQQEAARIAQEQEAARVRAQQEAARVRAQEQAAARAEAQRVAREQAEARARAEQERQRLEAERRAQQEAARIAQEQAAAKAAAERAAKEKEAARIAQQREEAKQAEAREAAAKAEAARLAQEQAARKAELDRIARQQEQDRIAEQARIADQQQSVRPLPEPASPLEQAMGIPSEQNEISAITPPPVAETRTPQLPTSGLTAEPPVARTGIDINRVVAQDLTPETVVTPMPESPLTQERNVVTPMPGTKPDAAPMPSIFEEGFSGEQAQPTGELDPAGIAKMMALFSLLPKDAFGNMGSVADPNIAANARTIEDTRPAGGLQGQQFEEGYLETQKSSPLLGIWESGLADVLAENPEAQARVDELKAERAAGLEQIEKSFSDLKPLSDLLKGGKFKEAFQYAESKGLTDHLMDTKKLKDLRGPFSQEEMAAFFNAIPADVAKKHTGEGYIFDPSAGVTGSLDPFGTGGKGAMESGFPDVDRAFSRKDTGIVKKVVDVGMQVALAAAGLPPLTAMAAAGVVKAATSGGDLEAALKAAAMAGIGSYVGGKVGEALEAAKGGTEVAAGQAVANAAKAAGSIDDLAEVIITASRQTLPGALTSVGTSLAGQEALKQGAKGAAEELEEIVVRSQRPPTTSLLDVAPPVLQQVIDSQKVGETLRETPAPEVTSPLEEIEEVVVKGSKPVEGGLTMPPLDLIEPPDVRDILKESPAPEIQYPEDIEEVIVKGTKPPEGGLTMPPLDLIEPPDVRDVLTQTPAPEIQYPEDIEEVIVKGTKPPEGGLTMPPFDLIEPPDVRDILKESPAPELPPEEEPMEEVIVKGTKPPEGGLTMPPFDLIEPPDPRDILKESPAPDINYPEESPWDKLKNTVDKLSTLQKLAALLGGLGGALSGGTQAPVTGGLPARPPQRLPKYEYKRVQTRPDIDYFTYGTRPEVMFFEDSMQRVEEPDTGLAPPNPEEGGVFARGGLAAGGRYYEGAGSGRDDKIPALLSDGEYVMDAETLALLGDGSTKEGAKRMDQFRAKIRKHKGSALSRGRISPNAKSPDKYMGGGLTR